jgi:outer membrane protein OmpA-like peptidoglycan-associated protein/tetratricopeptide (TPR) repeat protein
MRKNNFIKILASLILVLSTVIKLQAQNIDSTIVDTKTDSAKVEKVKKPKAPKVKVSDSTKLMQDLVKRADKIFKAEDKRYEKAVELYLQAEKIGDTSSSLYYNVGYSYFKMKKYDDAKKYFQKMIPTDSSTNMKMYYYLARINALQYNFDTAITQFDTYKRSLNPDQLNDEGKDIRKRIKECENAKGFIANSGTSFIDTLGKNVNTQYVEYAPIVSLDDSLLFFTARRPENIGGGRDSKGLYYEDIYFSKKDSNGNWSKAKNMGKGINTSDHDAAAGLSADKSQLIIYRSSGNGDLYLSINKDNTWGKAKKMNKFINTESHEASASFSYDMMKLYFSSDREGGYGGLDIYVSNIDEKGNWGMAENIRGKINSPYDEINLVPMPDGQTFYFTSNGHNGMGGLDIYKITYKDSMWSDAVNLGYPINTPDDDVLYSISADGSIAYIGRSNSDSNMHDVYKVTFMKTAKPTIDDVDGISLAIEKYGLLLPEMEPAANIQKMDLTVLKGKISDQFTGEPIYASIELTDNSTNQVIATFNSNEQTGNYLVSLPSGKDYGIAVKAENCLFYSDNISIKNAKGYKEIIKDIQLQKITVGSKVVLKNIFFATGKATLTKSSETELSNLLKLMNDIPTLKIEVSGHTDNVGSAKKNKSLSERRAKAVVDYLVAKGISKDRMVFKGYGFERPIASNKTKEGRQQNRRTEFEVISR